MKYLLLLLLLPIAASPAFADSTYRGYDYQDVDHGDLTHTWIGGLPPWIESGSIDQYNRKIFIPYKITQGVNFIKVETGNVSWVWDVPTCSMKLYSGKILNDSQPVIESVSYTLQQEINGNWTNTPHNNYSCDVQINQLPNNEIQLIAKQGDATIGFKEIELRQKAGKSLESFLKSPIDANGGKKFGFAESHVKVQDVKFKDKKFGINTVDTVIPKNNMTEIINGKKKDVPIITENINGVILFNSKDSIHNTLTNTVIKKYQAGKLQTVYDYHNTQQLTQGKRLEIDPTYTTNNPTEDGIIVTTSTSGTACGTPTTKTSGGTDLYQYKFASTGSGACYRTYIEWPIASISDTSIITDTVFKYEIPGVSNPVNCSINEMTTEPSPASASTIWTDIGDGTSYVSNNAFCTTAGTNKSTDLGTNADARVQAMLTGGDWFAIGVKLYDETRDASTHYSYINAEESASTPDPTLEITYYTPCTAPTLTAAATQSTSQIDLRWTPPSPSCTNTNYKVYKSTSGGSYTLETTLGNVTSTSVTGLSSAVQYSFKISTNSSNGWSSNSTVKTNSTVPSAPTITSSTPISKSKVNVDFSDTSVGSVINWMKSRYAIAAGGSWTTFHSNSSISTPRYENFTGLAANTTYHFQISEGNQGGFGDWSSNGTAKTYTTTSGTLSFVSENIGDTIRFNGTLSSISVSPSPQTASSLLIYQNGTLVKTESISDSLVDGGSTSFDSVYYQVADGDPHSYSLRVVASNNTGTVNIDSTSTNITREYDPDYFIASDPTQGLVNYTMSRTSNDDIINLKINRDKGGNTFNVECFYQTTAQVSYFGTDGTWHNYTSTGFVNDTYSNAVGKILYITCYNDGLLFTVTNYNNSTSLLLTGIEAFDNVYGGFIGVPVGVFFLVLVAGYANQRTAPMWIIIILAIAGVMSTIGIIDLDTNVWALALIAGLLGLLVGRKFF